MHLGMRNGVGTPLLLVRFLGWIALAGFLNVPIAYGEPQCKTEKQTYCFEILWNCRDSEGRSMLTRFEDDTIGKECRVVDKRLRQPPASGPQRYKVDAKYRQKVDRFRADLKPGDKTNIGMVIEVKPPIVRVQMAMGERWMRLSALFPE